MPSIVSPPRAASKTKRVASLDAPSEYGASTWGVSEANASYFLQNISDNPVTRHRRVMQGLESKDLARFVQSFTTIHSEDLLNSLGISERTLQRKQESRLNPQHSNAAMALMEITAQATRTLGSREAAERWLSQKALALEGEKPLDLLGSAPGIEAVKDLLSRMEYGVYA